MSPVTPAFLHASMDRFWPSFKLDEIIILFIEFRNLASIYSLLMQIIQQIRQCFLQASTEQRYHNKWFRDEAWRKIIANDFGFEDISKQNTNKALLSSTLFHPLQLHNNKRRITTVKKTFKGYFYLIANESTTKEILNLKLDWNLTYFNYRLPRYNNKRKIFEQGEC